VRETLMLLHGFTQTGSSWSPVIAALDPERYRPVAPDLRGHGTAASRRPITFEAITADVLDAVTGPFALAGYSQGGRIALHVALAAPQRITRLVLVSTTAGLEDPAERAERRAADAALAARIGAGTIEEFATSWGSQPLFASQPADVAAAAHAERLRNAPEHLAAALRGIGTGEMTPVWDRLTELADVPTTVLAGERDVKYVALGHRLARAIPDATLTIVPGAGHALPLEAPDAVARAIAETP
jgi:2-succinyl-6-hydroxy-2,4-cyclohexadiene-1-carboxylate synthase